jgi:cell division protein FtsB
MMMFRQQLQTNFWGTMSRLAVAAFAFLVLVCIVFLFIPLARQSHAMQQKIAAFDAELQRLDAHEKKLREQIEALRGDAAYIERTAREKLNLIKPGETIFRFEQKPATAH